MQIAFLGTGLMGTGFVRHLLPQGHTVRVWNRSADKARALESIGAQACADPAAAVAGADIVQLSLSDDAAVDSVLEPLAGRIPATTWIVDHTTTAPAATAERAARWTARGGRFVHAPVFMAPANAAAGTGVMLISGAAAAREALAPHLQAMTGKLVDLGEAPERAAAFKLVGNLVILGLLGVLGDVARLAQALGIPAAEANTLFEHFNPGAAMTARAARIDQGPYQPASFETTMARKDVRLMQEAAARGGVELLVMPVVAQLLDAAIARGEGALDCGAAARSPAQRAR